MGDINIDDLLDDLHEVTAATPQKLFSNVPPSSSSGASASYASQYHPHPPQLPNPGQNPKSRFVRADGFHSQKTSPTYKSTTTGVSSASNKTPISSSNSDPAEQNLDEWLDSLTISSPTINNKPSNTSSYSNSQNNYNTNSSNTNDAAVLRQSPSNRTQFPSSSLLKTSVATNTFSPSTSNVNNTSNYSQIVSNQAHTSASNSNVGGVDGPKLQSKKSHRSPELDNSWDEDDDAPSPNSPHSNENGSFSLSSLSNTSFAIKSNSLKPTISAVSSSSNLNDNSSTKSNQKQRCCQVVLGNALAQRGLRASSFSPCVCNALLCSQCNFKVLFFPQMRWQSSADYLFFRNNMPNTDKLRTKLERSEQSGAYCCQCQCTNVSATEGKRVLTIGSAQDPQWICTGHLPST